MTQRPRLVVGMSGSSAPHYGIALLETLHALGSVETHLVLSDGARRTIQLEADLDPELVCRLADVVHYPNNLAASISWGSFLFDGPLAGAHLPLHVRSELCGRLPGELLHRRRVRQSDPAPEGSGRVVDRGLRSADREAPGVSRADGVGLLLGLQLSERFPAAVSETAIGVTSHNALHRDCLNADPPRCP